MTYVKSSPKSPPSQANELRGSLDALFGAIRNVIPWAQVWIMMYFQYFFHLFPSAPGTVLFCREHTNIPGCPSTVSQGDRRKDTILHTGSRGVLLWNKLADTSTSCCSKIYVHLSLSALCVQHPEAPSTLHCSQVQPEVKENGLLQVTPQHGMKM